MTHNRATGSGVLPVLECSRLRSIDSYREICCSHPYWQETSFKSSADNVSPVTENYWFQSGAGSGVLPVQKFCRLQRLDGDKLVGQEFSSEKFL